MVTNQHIGWNRRLQKLKTTFGSLFIIVFSSFYFRLLWLSRCFVVTNYLHVSHSVFKKKSIKKNACFNQLAPEISFKLAS